MAIECGLERVLPHVPCAGREASATAGVMAPIFRILRGVAKALRAAAATPRGEANEAICGFVRSSAAASPAPDAQLRDGVRCVAGIPAVGRKDIRTYLLHLHFKGPALEHHLEPGRFGGYPHHNVALRWRQHLGTGCKTHVQPALRSFHAIFARMNSPLRKSKVLPSSS